MQNKLANEWMNENTHTYTLTHSDRKTEKEMKNF